MKRGFPQLALAALLSLTLSHSLTLCRSVKSICGFSVCMFIQKVLQFVRSFKKKYEFFLNFLKKKSPTLAHLND